MAVTKGGPESESKPAGARRLMVRRWALFLCVTCAAFAPLAGLAKKPNPPEPPDPAISYTPNPIFTTVFGPAAADVLVHPTANFLECSGGGKPIALCYYSGPPPKNKKATDLSCVDTGEGFSNCRCIEILHGPYFVDINAILDEEVYNETVDKCGMSGANCGRDEAPVCDAIRDETLFSDDPVYGDVQWDTISTFSLALNSIPKYEIGTTNCIHENAGLYSGCMTAPCTRTGDTVKICQTVGGRKVCNDLPIDLCTCPNVPGPYQIGTTGKADKLCSLPAGYTWSAAFNPTQALFSEVTGSLPDATACIPDAPNEKGCPMLPPDPSKEPKLTPLIPEIPPPDFDCDAICDEYADNKNTDNVEVGFTCDATVCTTPPTGSKKDPLLISQACSGLGETTPITGIAALELAIGCSCCASQICGCSASAKTNEKVSEFNDRQRMLGIKPQCDYNGSLCGDGSPQSSP